MRKLPPIVLAILIPALFILTMSTAEEENNAKYLADGSNTFWFVQITDTHISTWLNQYYDDNILFFLDEGIPTINPWFVINTGDLTDSTNGVNYLQGPPA